MIRHHATGLILFVGTFALDGSALAQNSAPAPASPQTTTSAVGLEQVLLQALQANPLTAPYAFSTERRGSKVALRGRVGTKRAHDAAIQIAIALGVPVADDLVIDTLARGGMMGPGPGYSMGGAGPSSGLGGFPGTTSLYGPGPYVYPQPLFGRFDEPFYGFEPPPFSYPPWWGALSAARVGPQTTSTGVNPQPPAGPASQATAMVDEPATNLPDGTIDMAIDPRGVATLRGTVPSLAERITLGQKVAQTPGVTQVVNLLNVNPNLKVAVAVANDRPPPPPVPADLGAAPAPAVRAVAAPDGAVVVADTEPVAQRASRALANRAGLANQPVKVKVRDGVASLSGKVPTVYEAMLAYRAVQRTPGVREVNDTLEFVVPDGNSLNPLLEKGRPDDVEPYLEAQIRRQVGDLAHVDRVRVQGDALELRGTLEREDDRERFAAIIRSMPILRGFRITADFPIEPR